MKSLRELLPRVSQSVLDVNQQYCPQPDGKNHTAVNVVRKRRGSMNRTEAEYAMILEQQKRAGEILDYWFEGITLRWNGVQYTPDFTVMRPTMQLGFIEIKGAFTGGKFERAVERFRHARTFWTYFDFELHKKTKQGWKRIEP